jgi:multiple sugar transport system permease protein
MDRGRNNFLTKFLKKDKWGYIFLSPWILFFVIFTAYPFFYGLIISFTDFDFINMRFVGINNYIDIIKDPLFAISTLNILKLAVIIIPFTLTASLWIAKEINNRGRHLQSFVKVSFYLNSIISEVALVIVWKWIFNSSFGASAALAKSLGLEPFAF